MVEKTALPGRVTYIRTDARHLRSSLASFYPLDDGGGFAALLQAIDQADEASSNTGGTKPDGL